MGETITLAEVLYVPVDDQATRTGGDRRMR